MQTIEYLIIYLGMGFVIGAYFSLILTCVKAYEIEFKNLYINYWAIIWHLENINNTGKIILETIFTVICMPFIIVFHIAWLISLCCVILFKRR